MNGSGHAGPDGNAESKDRDILQALQLVYDPRSPGHVRQEATRYLEEVRADEKAPFYGFNLARSKDQSSIIRHFGLSLIDHAIRFRWSEYSSEQLGALREWIIALAREASSQDPPYITNKIAEIWTEVAKRSWALDWMNMDENLVHMWNGSVTQKEMVSTILTSLSDEIFGVEDTVVALRDKQLNKACVEIFTPADTLAEHFPTRETTVHVRYGGEGWLRRMTEALKMCTHEGEILEGMFGLASKILAVFKSIITWIIPSALIATDSLTPVFHCLRINDVSIQLVITFPAFPARVGH